MPNPQCAHCGGRLLITGDKAHGQIATWQMCGRSPDTREPQPNEKLDSAAVASDRERARELAREKDRDYRRQRNRAARAAR